MKTKIAITLGAMALSAMSGALMLAPSRSRVKRSVSLSALRCPEGVYFVDYVQLRHAPANLRRQRLGGARQYSSRCLVNAVGILQRTH